jgi:hypothetical protein
MNVWGAINWGNVSDIEDAVRQIERGKPGLAYMSDAELREMLEPMVMLGYFEPVPPMADSALRNRLIGLRERIVNVFKGLPGAAHIPALRGPAAAPKYTTLDFPGEHYGAPAAPAPSHLYDAAPRGGYDRGYDAPRFDMDAPRYDSLPARNYDNYNNYDAPAYYSSPGLSGGAIAGIVVGTVAVAGIVLGLAFYLKKRTRKAEQREEQAAPAVQYNV